MNFASLVDYAINVYNQYPLVVLAVAIGLLFMAYKKPKESFKFALMLLFIAAVFYAIGLIRDTLSTGTQNKDQMINKSRSLSD